MDSQMATFRVIYLEACNSLEMIKKWMDSKMAKFQAKYWTPFDIGFLSLKEPEKRVCVELKAELKTWVLQFQKNSQKREDEIRSMNYEVGESFTIRSAEEPERPMLNDVHVMGYAGTRNLIGSPGIKAAGPRCRPLAAILNSAQFVGVGRCLYLYIKGILDSHERQLLFFYPPNWFGLGIAPGPAPTSIDWL